MDETQVTLLKQLQGGDEASWREADRLYRPLVHGWLRQFGLRPDDLDDLTQDVMLTLARKICTFDHNGHLGAFRKWLKVVTINQARAFLRDGRLHPDPQGGTLFREMLEQLADSGSEISRRFDREHDAHIIGQLLDQIGSEFSGETIKAFRMHVTEGRGAQDVADAIGISRWTVYQAKSRVLRRLRQRVGPWTDEMDVR